ELPVRPQTERPIEELKARQSTVGDPISAQPEWLPPQRAVRPRRRADRAGCDRTAAAASATGTSAAGRAGANRRNSTPDGPAGSDRPTAAGAPASPVTPGSPTVVDARSS